MKILQKLNLSIIGFNLSSFCDKLTDNWFLLLFVLNVVALIVGLIIDFADDKKINGSINYVSELNRFGEDLKNYYSKKEEK